MNSPISQFYYSSGLRLHFVEWGSSGQPAIVMLHGLRAYAHWFNEFAEAASPAWRLIALDQRGRGASQHAPDGVYTTDSYVSDLEALRAHLGLNKFILLGHSMGGINAINFAAQYPQFVEALIIVEAAPELEQAGLTRMRNELGNTPQSFASLEEAHEFLKNAHPTASESNLETRIQWMLKYHEGKYVWRIDPAIFNPGKRPDPAERTWAALQSIVCPTLIVRGAQSDLISQQTVERMADSMPDCRWVEISNARHMVLEDNETEFASIVLTFLDTLKKQKPNSN